MEPHIVEGRHKSTAHLEPWWAPGSSTSAPRGDEPSPLAGGTPWLRHVLEVITETTDPDLPIGLRLWLLDVAAVLEQAVGLEPWLSFIVAQFGLADPTELIGNERGEVTIGPTDEDAMDGPAPLIVRAPANGRGSAGALV